MPAAAAATHPGDRTQECRRRDRAGPGTRRGLLADRGRRGGLWSAAGRPARRGTVPGTPRITRLSADGRRLRRRGRGGTALDVGRFWPAADRVCAGRATAGGERLPGGEGGGAAGFRLVPRRRPGPARRLVRRPRPGTAGP